MSQVIRIDGAKLLVHQHAEQNVVEAYELALFLGYAQQHLLRKQVLTDWKRHFRRGKDYLLVTREKDIRAYELELETRLKRSVRPMKPARGRVFLLPDGLRQVLERSSKERAAKLLATLERKQLVPKYLDEPPRKPQKAPEPHREAPSIVRRRLPDAEDLLERRRQDYDVMQKLLEQLRELDDPALELLAVEAAEIMLGRSLGDLRERLATKSAAGRRGSRAWSPRSRGPLFGEERFYSLTQIGNKAGYSAKAAGQAANLVGVRWGFEPHQLREDDLWFTLHRTWEDEGGREHELVSFHRKFSNEVLDELRSNDQFRPLKPKPVPAFGDGSEPRLDTDVARLLEDETSATA